MNVLTTTVARVLFALPFAIFGISHFMNASAMAGVVPAWVPGGIAWVYITGLALIAASVSIITKRQGALACKLLALLLASFILTIHLPALGSSQMAIINLLKDMALAGAALHFAGIFESEEA